MITEERLKEALEKANDMMLEQLPDEKECVHKFSPRFERKMKKLLWRAKHEKFYTMVKKVSCVLAAILVGSGIVIASSETVQGFIKEWLKEKSGNWMVYFTTEDREYEEELPSYRLTALPEHYKEVERSRTDVGEYIVYDYEGSKNYITLNYTRQYTGTELYLDPEESTITQIQVGDYIAECYHTEDIDDQDTLIWIDEACHLMFEVSGPGTLEELVKLAESMEKIK